MRRAPAPGRRQAGFNLVALVILVTVMNVLVAAALPVWSHQIQRAKEEELIFRGLQYAEAIRVFQLRTGRYPTRLEELLEINPRSIRQLWTDPMREESDEEAEDGEPEGWGLVFAQQGGGTVAPQAGGVTPQNPQTDEGDDDDGRTTGQTGADRQTGIAPRRQGAGTVTVGPIVGVHSLSTETAIKTFGDAKQYNQWQFTVDILPQAPAAVGEKGVPSLNSRWVGRPFPEDVATPEGGDAPKDLIPKKGGEEEEKESAAQRRRRPRRRDGN